MLSQTGKQCTVVPNSVHIAILLVGKYPKPFEFFKLHFEEATPLANPEKPKSPKQLYYSV